MGGEQHGEHCGDHQAQRLCCAAAIVIAAPLEVIPHASHFELIAPTTGAYRRVVAAVRSILGS
jgi:hypothetical protein